MSGRGVLGKFGPNHAADPIVTRLVRLASLALGRCGTAPLAWGAHLESAAPPRLTASLPRRGWVARSPPCLVRRAGPRERPAADGGDQAQGHGRVGHPGRHGGRGRAGVCGSLFFAHPGGVDCTTHCFVRSIRRPLGGAGLGAAPGWRLSDRRALSSAGLTCCGVLPGPGIGDAEARVHGGGDGA